MFTPNTTVLEADPAGSLDELRRLGVDSIHLYLPWAAVAPAPTSFTKPSFNAADPSAYPASAWAPWDSIVRDTAARGMQLDVDVVAPPPQWASGKGAPHPAKQPVWRPSVADYAQFMTAIGTRYSGHYTPPGSSTPLPRVDFWSIWNEPNLGFQLAPQAKPHSNIELSGALYRGLVDAGWDALRATGHGSDTILIGEVGPAGNSVGNSPGLFQATAPLRFLRALYCVGLNYQPLRGTAATERGCPTTEAGTKAFASQHPGLFAASGFADHPYPQGLPPNQPTPNEPDFAELADIDKLERALDTMQRVYGSRTQFPIYSTEYGYQTTPPDTEAGTTSPTQAATYLNWSEYLTWRNPRLRTYDQYLLADPVGGYFATGLEFANGVHKPGYAAFRMPIYLPVQSTQSGQPLDVWGGVRPAHYARSLTHRTQHARIQFATAMGPFKTVATVPITDRYGYFDVRVRFPGSGRVRLAWSYPHGPEVFSRIVVITLR